MPFVALDALQREVHAYAPYVIPERQPKNHGGVKVLELVASIDGSPMRRRYCGDTQVSLRGDKVFHILVHAEQDTAVGR